MNDENEIIELSCEKCEKAIRGTYAELFGDVSSLVVLPKFRCKCGGDILMKMTGVSINE